MAAPRNEQFAQPRWPARPRPGRADRREIQIRSQCSPRDDARAAPGRVRAAGSLEQTDPVLPLVLGPASGGRRSGRRHEKLARGVACHLPGVRLAAVGRRPASPQRRHGPRHEPFFKGLGSREKRRRHRQSPFEGIVKANEYRRRRQIRPSAAVIREQKQRSSSLPLYASGQYRIYSDNALRRRQRGAPRSHAIWPSTISGARTRALTGARRTRLTSMRDRSRRPHEISAARWTRLRSGYALPTSRPAREYRKGPTPAAVHLAFAESCADQRDQLCSPAAPIARRIAGGRITGSTASRASTEKPDDQIIDLAA